MTNSDKKLLSIVVRFSDIELEHFGLKDVLTKRGMNVVKSRISNVIEGCFWAKVEIGSSNNAHLHIIGFEKPCVPHSFQYVKHLAKLANYLSKPTCAPTDANIAIFQAATYAAKRRKSRLPNRCFSRGIARDFDAI